MKKQLSLFCFCVLLLCLFNLWQRTSVSSISTVSKWNNSSGNVTILLWHWPFGTPFSLKGDVCWGRYRIPHCKLVDQRALFPVADVVVFHHTELVRGFQELPLELPRPQGQRWAWMSLEAHTSNGNLKKYANIFNMTITYRRDADVSVPYGEVLREKAKAHVVEDNSVNKSSLVCWVISNYGGQQKRSQVYHNLSAIVPVKVYGKWKNNPLPSRDLLPTISRCYFYLAFENSVAKDYITEKLWRNSYQAGAVPVVLGPPISDYKAVAPPNSFIHVDEFASVEEMGAFLQQLAKDKKHYNEYFAWKRQWKVKLYKDWRERLCKICLQYKNLPQQKIYTDLEAWANLKST